MLTIYPESELYQEIQNGNWEEEGELEKYRELRALVENLNISTYFAAMGASNAFQLRGRLPDDKKNLLNTLDKIISEVSEEDLLQPFAISTFLPAKAMPYFTISLIPRSFISVS